MSFKKGYLWHTQLPTEMAGYDLKQIEEIAMGDQDFVKELLSTLITSFEEVAEQIRSGLGQSDFASVGHLAHKIKPSLIMLNTSLKDEAIEIEHIGKSGNYDASFGDRVSTFLSELETLTGSLRQVTV